MLRLYERQEPGNEMWLVGEFGSIEDALQAAETITGGWSIEHFDERSSVSQQIETSETRQVK